MQHATRARASGRAAAPGHRELTRITKGPGHQIHGDHSRRVKGAGWENAHAAVDDHPARLRRGLPGRASTRSRSSSRHSVAWYAEQGLRIEQVLTDRGSGYRSRLFNDACRKPASATSTRGPTRPRPTARSNASSRPSPASGPTRSPLPARSGERGPPYLGFTSTDLEEPHHGLGGRTPWQRLHSSLNNVLQHNT